MNNKESFCNKIDQISLRDNIAVTCKNARNTSNVRVIRRKSRNYIKYNFFKDIA